MCSTGLNACNLGYGGQRTRISHRCHGKHGEHRKNCTSGTYGDRVERGESCKPRLNPRPEKWFFPDPVSPKSAPKWGKGNFFLHCRKKMPILFHSGNKRQFKLCSKSVSNYQNQLVEAEKLFKKSHIFAWFHCTSGASPESDDESRKSKTNEANSFLLLKRFPISSWRWHATCAVHPDPRTSEAILRLPALRLGSSVSTFPWQHFWRCKNCLIVKVCSSTTKVIQYTNLFELWTPSKAFRLS